MPASLEIDDLKTGCGVRPKKPAKVVWEVVDPGLRRLQASRPSTIKRRLRPARWLLGSRDIVPCTSTLSRNHETSTSGALGEAAWGDPSVISKVHLRSAEDPVTPWSFLGMFRSKKFTPEAVKEEVKRRSYSKEEIGQGDMTNKSTQRGHGWWYQISIQYRSHKVNTKS